MKKIVLAPDSFKGSLSAKEICESLESSILEKLPDVDLVKVPLADGGEGSLEAINTVLGAEEVKQFVKDPLWRTTTGMYLRKEETAYIEMASASGLHLVKESQRDPELATTYGTGQQIKHAVKNGCTEVYLFVGGSATNDAGIGIGQACGFKFLDAEGNELLAGGESLSEIRSLKLPDSPLEFKMKVVCDIDNPLFGPNGAAFIYAPQKGADTEMVNRLDGGLQNFAEVVQSQLGKEVHSFKGAGAAGGVPAGMKTFFDAEILPGTQTIFKIIDLENHLISSDLVITGEGKLDAQTLSGKLIAGVAELGKKIGVPVKAICGKNELNQSQLLEMGIQQVVSLVDDETNVKEAIENASKLIKKRVQALL
ncbi:glycerate kinase [Jiulongibacter sp. NS-SX5]|uniref:glycerate kinase n=1 Tax=Jiulongibacter sp. NS-SX5 TaxID=3463854 RepID=UPI00405912C6